MSSNVEENQSCRQFFEVFRNLRKLMQTTSTKKFHSISFTRVERYVKEQVKPVDAADNKLEYRKSQIIAAIWKPRTVSYSMP